MNAPQSKGDSRELTLLRTFWTLLTPGGKTITCAVYETPGGLELRAGQGEADTLLQQRVLTQAIASTYADGWKTAAMSRGFREIDQTTDIAIV